MTDADRVVQVSYQLSANIGVTFMFSDLGDILCVELVSESDDDADEITLEKDAAQKLFEAWTKEMVTQRAIASSRTGSRGKEGGKSLMERKPKGKP